MSLRLHYQATSTVPVEVEGMVPSVVRDMPVAEIARMPIYRGNEQLVLGDLFEVSGDPGDECLEFEGELAGVHWIGAGMSSGRIHVAGNAGRHVGSEMTGGEVLVDGDAGDWVGGEMHGGLIDVRGRAGHLIGAAYRGSARGMTGGTILVHGDVGNEIGLTMRRGTIAVGGSAGDTPGFNMIAGSVFIFGASGIRAGAGMRRGTIAILGGAPPMLPTFRLAGPCRPNVMRLYLLTLARLGLAVAREALDADYLLYSGDFLESGRGEILVRSAGE